MNYFFVSRPAPAIMPKSYKVFVGAVACACLLSMPLWVMQLFYPEGYSPGSGWLVTPLVGVLTVLGIAWKTQREPRFVQQTILIGYLAKLAALGGFLAVFFKFYGGAGDMLGYFDTGGYLADRYLATGNFPWPTPLWSQGFVQALSAFLQLAIGHSFPAEIAIFATLSFWGEYLFYRAGVLAFPQGNRSLMLLLMFFVPTVVYWSAPVGKDSLILFTMGLAVYGFVRLQSRVSPAAWFYLIFGLFLTGITRPHIGGMLALAFTLPFLISKKRRGLLGILGRILGGAVIVAVTIYLVSQAQSFVQADTLEQGLGRLQGLQEGLQYGGSTFGQGSSTAMRLLLSPLLPFRPFLWEARSPQMFVTALEGLVLLVLVWARRRSLWAALGEWRQNPTTLALAMYSLEFILVFSVGMGNFGTLSRMRAMLYPFFLLLLAAAESKPTAAVIRRSWRGRFDPANPPREAPVFGGNLLAMSELRDYGASGARRPRLLIGVTDSVSLLLLRGQPGFLRRVGFEVTVVCSPGETVPEFRDREGVEILVLPMSREIAPWRDAVALVRWWRLLRRLRPDLVNVGTPKAGLLGSLAARWASVPCRVYTMRGLRFETARGWKRRLLRFAECVACGCAQQVVCVSESLRWRAVDLGIVDAGKAMVLGAGSSNGVDIARFAASAESQERAACLRAEWKIPPEVPVIGFVGRLTRDKGLPELVAAFQSLRGTFPSLHLLLLGPKEEGDPLPVETQAALVAENGVVRPGMIEDMAAAYQVMNILCLPTHREGFPNAVLEAQAAGKPVVTTRATGAVDSIVDGVTGILVDAGDAAALAEALGGLLRDAGLAARMGEAGYRRALTSFAQEPLWQSLAALYCEMLQERGLPLPSVSGSAIASQAEVARP